MLDCRLLSKLTRASSPIPAGERIVVDVADTAYMLDVLEVKPERAATLYGNVDLVCAPSSHSRVWWAAR